MTLAHSLCMLDVKTIRALPEYQVNLSLQPWKQAH